MTDLAEVDLELLERLHAEATDPPWRAGRSDMTSYGVGDGLAFKNVYGPNFEPELHYGKQVPLEEARGIGERCHQNAQLIAAMRNAIPTLLAKAREHVRLVSALEHLPVGWTVRARIDEDHQVECHDAAWLDRDSEEEHSASGKTKAEAVMALAGELGWRDPQQSEGATGNG